MDLATGSLDHLASSFAPTSTPAPSPSTEVLAFERALAQLSEASTGLLAAYRSSQSTRSTGYHRPLSPSEAMGTATSLLANGPRTVHVVIGRPDVLGLLTRGPLLHALGESGAQTKALCQDVLRTEMGGRRALSDLTRAGAQVATTPAPPPPVVILDRQVAIVTTAEQPENGTTAGAALIHDPSVAGYMAAVVDAFWAISAPLHDAVTTDSHGLLPADRTLLRLLADGMTQQEAARKLHLSVRTISRRTAELKRILGAASPLQAGLEASRRGWL